MPAKWVQSLLKLQANDLRIRDLEQRMKLLPSEMNALKAKRDQLVASTAAAAEAVAGYLQTHADVESVEVVKAFVNVTLRPAALCRDSVANVGALLDSARLEESARRRILIEYSAPNTNKPQHLGHVRNNTIGMSLCSLLARVGNTVIPINLVNDRGIHICKSMLAYRR